jgi:PAS domain S-box-containing protein
MPLPLEKIEFADLQLLIDLIPALIHTSFPDGYLDYFNQPWLDYVGVALEDLQGWKWTNSIHPDDVAGSVETWRASLASGEVFEYKARVRRADGEYRWMMHHKVRCEKSLEKSSSGMARASISTVKSASNRSCGEANFISAKGSALPRWVAGPSIPQVSLTTGLRNYSQYMVLMHRRWHRHLRNISPQFTLRTVSLWRKQSRECWRKVRAAMSRSKS